MEGLRSHTCSSDAEPVQSAILRPSGASGFAALLMTWRADLWSEGTPRTGNSCLGLLSFAPCLMDLDGVGGGRCVKGREAALRNDIMVTTGSLIRRQGTEWRDFIDRFADLLDRWDQCRCRCMLMPWLPLCSLISEAPDAELARSVRYRTVNGFKRV